jgi:ketosteroid isomerase-like protein
VETLVRQTWAALEDGDLSALEAVLAPDARWLAVEQGPWDCENRSQILAVMRRNLENGIAGEIVEVSDAGPDRALVGFRPTDRTEGAWPLEDGIRWLVLTARDGAITEMKGCATRAAAEEYARTAG